MNTASVAPNFAHKSETQQSCASINRPGWLYVNLDGRTQEFPVADLSAGGFSVSAGLEALRLRQVYRGHLMFEVDGYDFAIDVNFVPRSFDSVEGHCGCEFQDLGHREFSALRCLITASLGGEMVSASDMLNTLAREGVANARNDVIQVREGKRSNESGFLGMPRAMVGSLMVMLVVLFGVSFVTSALSDIYFMTKAESEAGATFDAPEWWSYGNDLVGEGKYSVSQIDKLLDITSLYASSQPQDGLTGRPTGINDDPLWGPSLQEAR